jgi:hypothetical protein
MTGRLTGIFALLVCLAAIPAAGAGNPGDGRPAVQVPFPDIADWSSLRIRLQRTACYGWCPVYSVEIAGDGTVTYFGERFVKEKGTHTTKIAPEKVKALVQAFATANFFWTFDRYETPITDLPTQIVTLSFDGHTKTVVDYAGQHVGMPKAIDALEEAIDEAAGTAPWVGEERQP